MSGTVSAIRRGERRKITAIEIAADAAIEYEKFQVPAPAKASREKIVEALLQSGLWPLIMQRPYGLIASPTDTPKGHFHLGIRFRTARSGHELCPARRV